MTFLETPSNERIDRCQDKKHPGNNSDRFISQRSGDPKPRPITTRISKYVNALFIAFRRPLLRLQNRRTHCESPPLDAETRGMTPLPVGSEQWLLAFLWSLPRGPLARIWRI